VVVVQNSGPRLTAAQLKALKLLCQLTTGNKAGNFDTGIGQDVFGPVKWAPLTPAQTAAFESQWQAAQAAAVNLSTPQQAAAAGYVQASPFQAGVGTHWINWSLVSKPFDPTAPSMLLFDGMRGRKNVLAGFSFWVVGEKAPAGFAGPNDQWHRHHGLCFSKEGWLLADGSPTRSSCKELWMGGKQLWMLHAWVVPGLDNTWGKFAPTNPYLCPPISQVGDIFSCDPR
jgi:hypothetical protein